ILGTGLGGKQGTFRARLQLRAHCLVLDAATLVLEVPLDLTLDIRHSSLDAYGQEELSLRDPREYQLTERAGTPRPRWHDGSCGRPRGHSQLLDHQPRRPWQVDA